MASFFLIHEEYEDFRQYASIRSFCNELSQMRGVSISTLQSYTLDLVVPYSLAGPDLFDVAALYLWFQSNVRGPDFPRYPGNKRGPHGWWDIDKAAQKAWKVKAEKELADLVGQLFPKTS